MKLGIIGAGFVGGSVIAGFDRDVEQFVVDPLINDNTIIDLVNYDPPLLFVCVPTPETKSGDVDESIDRQTLSEPNEQNHKGIEVNKSTITTKPLTKMKKDYKLNLVYNPEFLTEANAHVDFINPNMQVLGASGVIVIELKKHIADIVV